MIVSRLRGSASAPSALFGSSDSARSTAATARSRSCLTSLVARSSSVAIRRRVRSSFGLVRRCGLVDLLEDLGRSVRRSDRTAARCRSRFRRPPPSPSPGWRGCVVAGCDCRNTRASDCLVGSLSSSVPASFPLRWARVRRAGSEVARGRPDLGQAVRLLLRQDEVLGRALEGGGDDGRAGLRVLSGSSFVVTFAMFRTSAVSAGPCIPAATARRPRMFERRERVVLVMDVDGRCMANRQRRRRRAP